MEQIKWFSPYDPTRRIGSVINVSATELIVNLSSAGSGEASWSFGNKLQREKSMSLSSLM
jgi:hypothetical protein